MVNYFDMLGFGNFGERTQAAAANTQNLFANQQAMDINKQNQQRQMQADQQAALQFQSDQQKQRAAQGAGAFYNALNSGNDQAALQLAREYAQDINSLGDPSFTVDSVTKLMETPEGKEQLKQMSLGMVQIAAGPEQVARFTAAQAAPERAPEATAQIKNTAEYRRYTDAIRQAVSGGDRELAKELIAERDFFVNQVDPYARSFASGRGTGAAKIGTEQQLNPILAERARGTAEAQQSTAAGQAALTKAQADAQAAQQKLEAEQIKQAGQVDLSRQAARLAREIATDPNFERVTGAGTLFPTILPESQDVVLKAEQLISLLTADNLTLMSGVLTDRDIQMLATLSSGMRVTDKGIRGSAPAIRKRLTEIATSIDEQLGQGELMQSQPMQQPTQQAPQGQRIGRFIIEVE